MESKWFLFPGQTVENTKISDRAHALHITKTAWGNITQHLDRKKRIQEAIERERAHKQALKEGSQAMTKEWKNSIENIRLRKDQERREHLGQKKEDKIQLFYKMREEQDAIRKEIVGKIRKQIFESTGHPKQLTSALVLSETLYERDRQKEFNAMIKQREKEIERQTADLVIESAEKERREDEEKKQKKLEEGKKVAQVLMEQIKENERIRKEEIRLHIEKETQDGINAAREEELLKQFEFEEKLKRKREIQREQRKQIRDEQLRQQHLKKENDEIEKATEFYSKAKKRIDCMMKIKEKEMRDERIANRLNAARKAAAEQVNREKIQEEITARAVAEREAVEKAKVEAKRASEAQAREDRIEDRKRYLERLEREKLVENEIKRWEMLNRIKTAEVMQEYDVQKRKDKWAKILQYRKELLEQM
ncbi:trichohyalin-like, partial [Asbolus verrucosus]